MGEGAARYGAGFYMRGFHARRAALRGAGGDGRAGGVFLGVRSGMGGWLYGEAEVSAWAVIVLMLRQELLLRLLSY